MTQILAKKPLASGERDWWLPAELARHTGLAEKTLKNWRVLGKGPKYRKLTGRVIVYPLDEIRAWIEQHPVVQSTTEEEASGSRG